MRQAKPRSQMNRGKIKTKPIKQSSKLYKWSISVFDILRTLYHLLTLNFALLFTAILHQVYIKRIK